MQFIMQFVLNAVNLIGELEWEERSECEGGDEECECEGGHEE